MPQRIGPVILDLEGPTLRSDERELLQHPLVGGVIFFSRHFESPQQMTELCRDIRRVRPELLLTVDQEGGRVQRFKNGFTRLPSLGQIGSLEMTSALKLAESCGWLMAAEIRSLGIDLSFAPVLDLDKKLNSVVGDRSFHFDPEIVVELAVAFQKGMRAAGMGSTGKHFPGHGSVTVDSHEALPTDTRSFDEVAASDLIPFVKLIQHNMPSIMAAHIVFPQVDDKPVGFSSRWLKEILRKKLGFSGLIFSDDLNMRGAATGVNYADRAQAALEAGCDMILICNNRAGALQILEALPNSLLVDEKKLHPFQEKFSHVGMDSLKSSPRWQEHHFIVNHFLAQEIS